MTFKPARRTKEPDSFSSIVGGACLIAALLVIAVVIVARLLCAVGIAASCS